MTSIFQTTYAHQHIVPRVEVESVNYMDALLAGIIRSQLEQFYEASRQKDEELDWATLTISTRWDELVDGLLVSSRVNAS